MLLKRTHTILEILLGVFVFYLLVTRAFISWAQYAPESFSETLSSALGIELRYDSLSIDQNWLGFELDVDGLIVESEDALFEARSLQTDLNLFSFIVPVIPYGDYLKVDNAVFQRKTEVEFSNESDSREFSKSVLHQNLLIPEELQTIWKQVSIKDFRVTYQADARIGLHLKRLELLKSSQITLVSEFGVRFEGLLNYETFSLSLHAKSNAIGGIDSGRLSLVSYDPVKVNGWIGLLPSKWHEILPKGEVLLELEAYFNRSKLSEVITRINGQSLAWPQNDEKLPNSAGAELEWKLVNRDLFKLDYEWNIKLLKLQLDNLYLDKVSPIEWVLEDDFVSFQSKAFDIEPFKILTQALIHDHKLANLFDQTAHLSIKNLSGKLNWQTLDLPQLHFYMETLGVPKTDYPSLAIQNFRFDKDLTKIELKTDKPVWFVDTRFHKDAIQVNLPPQIVLNWNGFESWEFEPFDFRVDDINLAIESAGFDQDVLKLNSDIQTNKVGEVLEYLPYPWMSKPLTKWLSQSEINGQRLLAKLAIDAPLEKLQSSGQGISLSGRVEKAQLKFNSKWPKLKNFDVDFDYRDYVLNLLSNSIVLDSRILAKRIQVDVRDLSQREIALKITGQATAEMADAIKYLLKTPLIKSKQFKHFLNQRSQASGSAEFDFKEIWVPVSGFDQVDEKVDLSVKIKKGSLAISGLPEFSELNGKVRVTQKSVSSKGLNGVFLHGPVDLVLTGGRNRLEIQAKGEAVDQDELFFNNPVPWTAKLTVPYSKDQEIKVNSEVSVQKAESLMPKPLSQNELLHPLFISGEIKDSVQLELESKGVVKALLQIEENKESLDKIEQLSGNILIGDENPYRWEEMDWPKNKKLNLDGGVEEVPLSDWRDLLNRYQAIYPDIEGHRFSLDWGDTHLDIKKLLFNNYSFPNSQLSWMKRVDNDLVFRVVGPKLDMAVIQKPNKNLDIQVGNLILLEPEEKSDALNKNKKAFTEGGCRLNAFKMSSPEIKMSAKQVDFHGYHLTDLGLHLIPDSDGYGTTYLKGSLGNQIANIEGAYLYNESRASSSMILHLDSKRVQALTDYLKINKGFKGKTATAKVEVQWAGDFSCFDVNRLKGPLEFKVEDGVIEDVEPGLARLLGLLSVDSIMRRLKLDMKDVTSKGLIYDEIKGNGEFNHEFVELRTMHLKAPSTEVEIKGLIDINKEEFDLSADVTPALGSSLPTLAAIAGAANPLAAIAVYTLMKVLPNINEELVTFEYKITGPWREPVLKLVSKEK